MKLLEVVNAPWAIVPEQLLEIREIYAAHLRGDKIDLANVEARLGRPLKNERQPYEVHDGVAIISIIGIMAQRANLFMNVSGGVSTQMIARDINEALADEDVTAIVLRIDSPGGTVSGTQELARVIRAANKVKPVTAFSDGMIASAAYWIASAADKIIISDATVQVGSIGVVATHVDVSEAEKMRGTKTTEITAGRYKRIASQYGSLTEDGRKVIQEQLDYIYEIFVNDVAAHRHASVDKVLEDMADGRMFIGKQALTAGLVDEETSLNELIGVISSKKLLINRNSARAGAASDVPLQLAVAQGHVEETEMPITLESLKAEALDVHKAVLQAGADAERARIKGIEANSMPGHDALVQEMKWDGITTPESAAVRILVAEKAAGAARLDNFRADAPTPAALINGARPEGEQQSAYEAAAIRPPQGYSVDADRAALHQKAVAYAAANKTDYLTAVKAVSQGVQ